MDNSESPKPPEPQPTVDAPPPPEPQPVVQTPVMTQVPPPQKTGTSSGITAIVVVALFLMYPLGIILMWVLTKWPIWVKILITSLAVIMIVLSIFLVTLLGAINPAKQFSQADDIKRKSDVHSLLNGIEQIDSTNPQILASITTTPQEIKSGPGGVDLCNALIQSYYQSINQIPEDPSINQGIPITACSSYDTGYTIAKDTNGKITISAPHAELNVISASE